VTGVQTCALPIFRDVTFEGLASRFVSRRAVAEGGEAVRDAAHGAEGEENHEERSLDGMHEGLRQRGTRERTIAAAGCSLRDRGTIDSTHEGTRGWGVQGEFRRPKAEDV
jgi:hypothetical protein